MRPDIGVVLVAAGRGVRAGGGVPKQFRELAGVPLLLRSLRPFLAHRDVRQIAVVLPAEHVADPPGWLAEVVQAHGGGTTPEVLLTAGGAERADSVRRGLATLAAECRVVLVHDAARPFVTPPLIDRVAAVARAGEGAVPALPVADTLKRAAGDPPRVQATVPREGLWRAQTPQGFPRVALEAGHASPLALAEPATDDAALVERIGVPVRLVEGSVRNVKLTTSDDFAFAEQLASLAGE